MQPPPPNKELILTKGERIQRKQNKDGKLLRRNQKYLERIRPSFSARKGHHFNDFNNREKDLLGYLKEKGKEKAMEGVGEIRLPSHARKRQGSKSMNIGRIFLRTEVPLNFSPIKKNVSECVFLIILECPQPPPTPSGTGCSS